MGVAVDVDGRTQIIEYSDLPPEVAEKTDAAGLAALVGRQHGDPCFHASVSGSAGRARGRACRFMWPTRKSPTATPPAQLINPAKENAYKFERFIFDALPLAGRALVLETDRAREFNPVKNATGDDSPETARAALGSLFHGWLRAAGANRRRDDRRDQPAVCPRRRGWFARTVKPGTKISEPTFLN